MRTTRTFGISSLLVVAVVAAACSPDGGTAVTPAPSTPSPSVATATTGPRDVTVAPSTIVSPPSTTAPEATSPRPTMPPPVAEEGSVRSVIADQPELSNINAAIDAWLDEAPGREGVLRNGRGVTVFLPDDDGFTESDLAAAVQDLDAFTVFLSEHLRVGIVTSDQLGSEVKTAMGAIYPVTDGPSIGGRLIVRADIAATNGVVHVIEGPLAPYAPGG